MKNIKKYIPKNADGKVESVLWEWNKKIKKYEVSIYCKNNINDRSEILFKFECDMVSDKHEDCVTSPPIYSNNLIS